MTIKSTKDLKNGNRQYVIELPPYKSVLVLDKGAYYQLPDHMADVIHAETLLGARKVEWSETEQQWIKVAYRNQSKKE